MVVALLAAALLAVPADDLWFRTPHDDVYCGASSTTGAFTCFRPATGFWARMENVAQNRPPRVRSGIDPRLRGFRDRRVRLLRVGESRWSSDAALVACENRPRGLECMHWLGRGWLLGRGRGARVWANLTPRAKAALVVVSGLPAPTGVGGVIVRRWDRHAARPPTALVFADQEGGETRAFPSLPPFLPASAYTTAAQARRAGEATGKALRAAGVDATFAPVADLRGGPLGSRHFQRPEFPAAFVRGLTAGRVGGCVKHFPGLGSAAVSTDERPHVDAVVRREELRAFRAAIDAGAPCVMTSNAFYGGSRFRASISPATYRLLRRQGFRGVAITDSLSLVRAAPVERWAPQALRAGADMVLFTSPAHARRAIRALVPLAAHGELDRPVDRVLRLRWRLLTLSGPVGP